jgi:hypothetical protein
MKERVLSDHGTAMVGIAKQCLLAPAVSGQQRFLAQLCGFSSRQVVNACIEAACETVKAERGVEAMKPKLVLRGHERFRDHLKLHTEHLAVNGVMPSRARAVSRLTRVLGSYVLRWLEKFCFLGFAPGKVYVRWVEGEKRQFNVMHRAAGEVEAWKCFKAHADSVWRKEHDPRTWLPGKGSFKTCLRLVTTRVQSKACLDTFCVKLLDQFDTWEKTITHMFLVYKSGLAELAEVKGPERAALARNNLPSPKRFKAKIVETREVLKFAKHRLPEHLKTSHQECDGVGVHCVQCGLHGCDRNLDHSKECSECMKHLRHGWSIRKFVNQWTNEFLKEFEADAPSWSARSSSFDTESSDIKPGSQGSMAVVHGKSGPDTDVVRLLRGDSADSVYSPTGTAHGRCASCLKVRWLHGVDNAITKWTCADAKFSDEGVDSWCNVGVCDWGSHLGRSQPVSNLPAPPGPAVVEESALHSYNRPLYDRPTFDRQPCDRPPCSISACKSIYDRPSYDRTPYGRSPCGRHCQNSHFYQIGSTSAAAGRDQTCESGHIGPQVWPRAPILLGLDPADSHHGNVPQALWSSRRSGRMATQDS